VKISNRKLAKRVKTNEALLVTLTRERINHLTTEEFSKAKHDIEGQIERDVMTLVAYGYDRRGREIKEVATGRPIRGVHIQ
jgi:hypothetical protein